MAPQGRFGKRADKNNSFGRRQRAADDFHKERTSRKSSDSKGRSESSAYSKGGKYKKSVRPRTGDSQQSDSRGGERSERRFDKPRERRYSSDSRDDKGRGFRKGPGRPAGSERRYKSDSSEGSSRGFRKGPGRPEGSERRYKSDSGEGSGRGFRKGPGRPEGTDRRRRRSDGDDFRRDKPEKERSSFVESRISRQREKVENQPVVKDEKDADGLIRLNKFIANSGVCSRREADELIKMGLISVNGVTVTEMGHKVKPTDDVRHEGKRLTAERPVYILLNKPKGFITTTDDPQDRNTVMHLVSGACKERVYPVGRLDRNTTGLLLLTNDGDLADKLTHPSYDVRKIYKVELDKPLSRDDFEKIREGVRLEEGKAQVDDVAIVSDDGKTVGLELHIGWNHVVRRIFDTLGYAVVKLDRVVYAGLDKKDLKRGDWRFLRTDEIVRLKHFK